MIALTKSFVLPQIQIASHCGPPPPLGNLEIENLQVHKLLQTAGPPRRERWEFRFLDTASRLRIMGRDRKEWEDRDKEDMTPTEKEAERTEFFRASVGAMLVNAAGQVLVLQRADVAGEAWQMPQGGLRQGEDPQQAMQRELKEEIGILPEHYVVTAVCTDWLAYELPEVYRNEKVGRGQVQKWFLCRFHGKKDVIKPDGIEFVAYEWVEQSRLLDLTVPFRRSIYERLLRDFGPHLKRTVG